jgi:pSer/pThr/pTyr-binding forkhead associated (FHA) protein
MSRTQCRFLHHQGLLFIEDLGATNPTLLNGRALTARSPAPLKVGDAVLAGSTLIEIATQSEVVRNSQASKRQRSTPTRAFQNPLIYAPKKVSFLGRLALASLRILLVGVIATLVMIQIEARQPASTPIAQASLAPNDLQLAKSFFEGALNSSDEFQQLQSHERLTLLSCISETLLKPYAQFDSMIDAFNQNNEVAQSKLKVAIAQCSNHHLDSETK